MGACDYGDVMIAVLAQTQGGGGAGDAAAYDEGMRLNRVHGDYLGMDNMRSSARRALR